jgi:two-component system, chemotaxis family, CheB/CheR fusion protein
MVTRKKSTAISAPAKEAKKASSTGFPIVGLGASAGGLEAFEQFFRKVSNNSGMAFVLVSHLDPEHASILTAILQRSSTISVVEAENQMTVAPNCVYVIPPNREMAIFHGSLQLSIPEQPRGHRMPIDHFLRSLAEDQGEHAIGIILSGTGTDGTQGLRAILGAGGISFVQEPETAKYSGMPASAIQAGYATHVLPVEKMPEVLLAGTRTSINRPEPPAEAVNGFKRILMLLRSGTGHDFSQYKRSTVGRRIERRMSQHNIEDTQLYARYLKEHPAEVQLLFKEILINVTSFFRDPEAFDTLRTDILPKIFAGKPSDYIFRIWVPGCATGEEAYSIAILLREFMDEIRRECKVQIYGTDLDEDAIVVARTGMFSPTIAQDMSSDRLNRFFVKRDAGYQIKKNIREMVVFATQNVIKDPPFTKLDLLSCRNLMIYLEPEIQSGLIPTFHYALKPDGVLFLSSSESTGNHSDLFAPISRKWKIYRAIHSANSTRTVMTGGLSWAAYRGGNQPDDMSKKTQETNIAELAKRMLLQSYAPASVITDLKGNILYVHGETGKYLRPAPGQASLNVIDMARDGLQLDLRTAIQSAASQGIPTLNRELLVKTNGDFQPISFCVRPVKGSNSVEDLLLLSFQDAASVAPNKPARGKRVTGSVKSQRIQELERDLAHTRENLQAIIEEQQASNEELKSTNEEMQSTNEELQSTNEELETSKEELQSVNEELITVNAELQAKIEQLADMQNDMKNLLDNISVGTIFLDQHLVIRRFTREAARAYRLVASDIGRSLADIKPDLEDEDLLVKAQNVLETLVPYEHEVHTKGGEWYLARIQPYRTLDNVIEGVVLTFTDIGKRVEAEIAVQEARELAEGIVDTVREPLIVLNSGFRVVSASRYFYQYFQLTPALTVGRLIYEIGDHQWDIPKLRELLEKVLPLNESFEDYAVEYEFPVNGLQTMLLNARRIISKKKDNQMILLAVEVRIPIKNEAI